MRLMKPNNMGKNLARGYNALSMADGLQEGTKLWSDIPPDMRDLVASVLFERAELDTPTRRPS
jgi:hypothetical protein